MSFEGRTVANVEEHPAVLRITFTDGWVYERWDDSHGRLLSPMAQRQVANADVVRRARWDREAAQQRRAAELRKARIARARSMLSPRVFEAWRRKRYPTMDEVLKETWTGARIMEQMNASSLFDRLAS